METSLAMAPELADVPPVSRAQGASHPAVRLRGIRKSFEGRTRGAGAVDVLQDIDIDVREGEFVSIVGPSGCGKSTILRMISGLTAPSGGEIAVKGAPIEGAPSGVGFMFQSDALLPWATVRENILVGLELGPLDSARYGQRLAELMRLVGLEQFADFYPNALSGGMRQRVSLARTLAYEPSIFLMDEPFGALDAQTKIVLGREFLRIWSEHRRTVLFVTHDIAEAITMSDRILVMSARPGRIIGDFTVPLERPRDYIKATGSEGFSTLYQQIWAALMHGSDDRQP